MKSQGTGDFLLRRKKGMLYPLPALESGLMPMRRSRGAVLAWTFDEADEGSARPMLTLELTAAEAEIVRTTDTATTGLLEGVRPSLRHRVGILLGYDQDITPFIVRAEWSEQDFVAELLVAATSPALYQQRVAAEARFDEPAVAKGAVGPVAASVRELAHAL